MKKVVIIGAGPAGLSCAYNLLKNNKKLDVTIIEEDSVVGGISKTVNYKGNRIDIGGHRFFTKNKKIQDFYSEILPIQGKPAYDDILLKSKKDYNKNGPDPEDEDKVLLIRNRVSRIYYNKKFFDYPINVNLKTLRNMGFITSINCGLSYIKSLIIKKQEDNLENFYINRFGKKLYGMFFEGYTTKVWGRKPNEIDSSWGSQRVKGISIKNVLKDFVYRKLKLKNKNKETSLIDSFYYPKYGPGEFYEIIADKIIKWGGKILYNSKVVKIEKDNNNIKSIGYMKNNKRYDLNCDILISSMPIKDLMYSMNAPKNIRNISDKLPYRDFITVGVLVPNLKIKDKNKKSIHNTISDNWIYVQDEGIKMGRIQIFNNWSPYMLNDPVNTIWLGLEYFCSEGDSFWNLSDKEIIKLAEEELIKMGICNSNVLDSCIIRVKKAYPAYFDGYKDINKIRDYLNKIENIFCIGRNGTHSYNNMDHSILSGLICSDMILKGKYNIKKLWNINTEKSYNEIKNK